MKKNIRIIICVVLLFIASLVLFFATKSYYLVSDRSSKIMEFTKKGYPVMGWVRVQGTNIDYPVVQGEDNDFYLNHDFNKNYLASGSIFMDYRNDFENDKNS